MTSSERTLAPGQPRWNYGVCEYKRNADVFLEPGLFSIVVLAHGRPEVTKQTVLSTLKNVELYPGEVEFIFIENGDCDENYEFFQELELDRKVIIRQRNYGINEGLNQGWALSRGEYVMVLENDWHSRVDEDFLTVAKDIFEEQPKIGMIQLRDPRDPHENHGLGKPLYNPFTCDVKDCHSAGVTISRQKTKKDHTYLLAGPYYAFNNNPIIIRKEVYRQYGPYPEAMCGTDPRHGETLLQEKMYDGGVLAAYIGMPLYWHAGKVQTKGN